MYYVSQWGEDTEDVFDRSYTPNYVNGPASRGEHSHEWAWMSLAWKEPAHHFAPFQTLDPLETKTYRTP